MQKQSLSRETLAQQMEEKCLEDTQEAFGNEQIAALEAGRLLKFE